MAKRYFTREVFDFLNELEPNNEKGWWEANKDRYIRVIREPALEFITDFDAHLKGLSPHFVADSRTVGGSLMRPYRDTRFTQDKTPYKTNVGIHFRHEQGKDVHAPGFYLHIEPRACFAAVGLWRPETPVARRIRQAIHDKPEAWIQATMNNPFTDVWEIDRSEEYMLKRVPREVDDGHPYSDDLRLKSFVADSRLTQSQITSGSFDTEIAAMFKTAAPLTRFLCEAIGLPF